MLILVIERLLKARLGSNDIFSFVLIMNMTFTIVVFFARFIHCETGQTDMCGLVAFVQIEPSIDWKTIYAKESE